jgi:hypothetical protein
VRGDSLSSWHRRKAWLFAAWCTRGIALAVLSLLMTGLAAAEVAAALRRLRAARRGSQAGLPVTSV